MAEPILYKIEKPDGAEVPFTGIKPNIHNADFDQGDWDRIVYFVDTTECLRDDKGNPAGIVQHPLEIWKEVNINTPFFKECCHKRLLVPKAEFHFFHSLKGDTQLINYFTIEMEQILILSSKIVLYDISEPHHPEKGIYSVREKPYVEKITLSAQLITWKYKRDAEPCAADHGTQFYVP
jgi:type VI secretion system Hcp family effector